MLYLGSLITYLVDTLVIELFVTAECIILKSSFSEGVYSSNFELAISLGNV